MHVVTVAALGQGDECRAPAVAAFVDVVVFEADQEVVGNLFALQEELVA